MVRYVHIDDPAHPLAADFVALNDPDRRRTIERNGNYFVVEGLLATERLLDLVVSDGTPAGRTRRAPWSIRNLLLLPNAARRLGDRLDALDALVPADARPEVAVAVAEESVLREVVGFDLHRGALASVNRRPPEPLDALLPGAQLLLGVEGVNDHENLGGLYRNAAGFGVGGVVIDAGCADPFYRRSVRVSMGHVLAVPTARVDTLATSLDALHARGVQSVALTPSAAVDLTDVDRGALGAGPIAVLVGAEGPGLTAATLARATFKVSIGMAPGIDSLNVATAAAIALHHLRGPVPPAR